MRELEILKNGSKRDASRYDFEVSDASTQGIIEICGGKELV